MNQRYAVIYLRILRKITQDRNTGKILLLLWHGNSKKTRRAFVMIIIITAFDSSPGGGGGGGVLPYISYIGMCHPNLWGFYAVLVWTLVFTFSFTHFSRNRIWFLRELQECMNVFSFHFQMGVERTRNMRIRNGFEEFFCLPSNLSNYNIISA